ncbi:type I-E CRISPR-associated protein Cas6/Cse3/CasE [Nocardiopsis sp. N85]|uniref:type I-E CRISPR-associated protein Cas6/Cse3/CasE n=1 Tax=Nocardiopsis sp. N85 TaxID=3029400 RepID=UPI00237F0FAA|nr:type I-E CRISPR-associated protein Cas6/Cse3/CasE [Nocardiopsis sp. N85]MDE3721881.1 type I-E CRISPR-associated protein Cas6/Cse3/CasE [Nocardiopsis sp. N85]
MHLARISLNTRRAPRMDQWATMGAAVRDALGADAAGSDVRLLWARTSPTTLIISCDSAPHWEAIPGAVAGTVQPLPRHTEGEVIRWELITAPTTQREATPTDDDPNPRSKRVPLAEDGFREWLDQKLADAAQITSVRWKRLGGRPARYHFVGEAVVRDSDALQDLCLDGIGAGKGTGAGLLLTGTATTTR